MATKPNTKFRSVRKQHNSDALIRSKNALKKTSSAPEHNNNNNKSSYNYHITKKNETAISPSRDYLRINGPHKRNPSQSVMVRLKRLDTLRLNQRILVKDYGYGSIQFLGCVHFAQGLFVGVELDEAKGKHDGSYHGKRYFTAKDKHGVLVKQHRVELLDVDKTDEMYESNNNSGDQSELRSKHIASQPSLVHYDEFLFDASNHESLSLSQKKELLGGDNDDNNNNNHNLSELTELKLKNETLNNTIEEYIKSFDDLEVKISNLERENRELKQEKLHFENEMNTKIEELEDQLEQIRVQLQTKDQVLKKQISNHENTKIKFRKKIKEHEELKQKNQDIVQLILYGDKSKDDIIFELRKKEKKYQLEKQEYLLEMERIQNDTSQKINNKIEQWIFDFNQD